MSRRSALAVVPATPDDPIAAARTLTGRHGEATTAARAEVTTARMAELDLQTRFDAGDKAVTVTDVHHARVLRESAERKQAAREAEEEEARRKLTALEKAHARGDYEALVDETTSWRARMAPVLARLAALDEELARIVEAGIDVVAAGQLAHEKAAALEATVRPVASMRTRGIEAPTMEEARYLAQVHVARVRARADRDGIGDGWLTGLTAPDWRDPSMTKWKATVEALDAIEKEGTK